MTGMRGGLLLAALAGLFAVGTPAVAQDNAACEVYPQLCEPPTTVTTTVTTPAPAPAQAAAPVTSAGGAGPQSADQPGTQGNGDDDGAPLPDEAAGANPAVAGRAPVRVGGRGAGGTRPGCERYAIIHLGDRDVVLERLIRRTLGEPMWVGELHEPIDVEGLGEALASTPFAPLADENDASLLGRLGRRLGREAVTPAGILPPAHQALFDYFEGRLGRPSGIVLTRDPDELTGEEKATRDRLVRTLLAGLVEADVPTEDGSGVMDVPVVGVEESTDKPSDIRFYKRHDVVRTVDNLDQRAGRNALAILMDGPRGHIGIKDTADGPFPTDLSGPRPLRCREALPLSAEPTTAASSPVSSGTVGMVTLLALLGGWGVMVAGRRAMRRRLETR